jgi:hypothetical protein
VIDSPVVKTTRIGDPERGLEQAPSASPGASICHFLVDTNGLVLAARMYGTDLPDRDGGRRLLGEELRLCRGWSLCGRTARTRAGSASGPKRSEGGE